MSVLVRGVCCVALCVCATSFRTIYILCTVCRPPPRAVPPARRRDRETPRDGVAVGLGETGRDAREEAGESRETAHDVYAVCTVPTTVCACPRARHTYIHKFTLDSDIYISPP